MLFLHAHWSGGHLFLDADRGNGGDTPNPNDLAAALASIIGWKPVEAADSQSLPVALSWPAWCDIFAAVPSEDDLSAIDSPVLLARGAMAAPDLQGWARLWRFAGSLVARQRYLPSIASTTNGFEAHWEPVYPDSSLSASAPPAARAAAHEFIAAAVDFIVRRATTTTLTRAHARRALFSSVHDAWFAALRDDSPSIRWEPREDIASLQATMAKWHLPVAVDSARIRFHLVAPPAPTQTQENGAPQTWRLTVSFDGGDSLPASLADRVVMLTALGQAAKVCPLPDDIFGKNGAPLSTSQAYAFLTTYAPRLADTGYGVNLPEWWRPADPSSAARIALRGSVSEITGDLASIHWEVVLGDDSLTLDDIRDLAEGGEHLVAVRGRWIEADKQTLSAARRILSDPHDERIPVTTLLRFALGGGSARGLPIAGITADGPSRRLLEHLQGGTTTPEQATPPATFNGSLRPYQLRGLSWMLFLRQWGFGACLADDMGLGKTIQALALLLKVRDSGEKRPALLVCPTTIIGNWAREAARFAPSLRVLIHHGPSRLSGEALREEAECHDLVITSYALLPRDFPHLREIKWSGMLLDEAQNIKNASTRQSKAARALSADYRIALTGTPVENHVGELWTLMDFLNPGLLGNRATFRAHIQIPLQTGIDPSARPRLRRLVRPFILRRMKTDPEICAELPRKFSQKVFCPLTREQARLYAAELRRLDDSLKSSTSAARRGLVLATLTRLKQICNHPAHYLADGSRLDGRSGKLARLEAMVEEMLETGDRALIFTQFVKMGELIQRHLDHCFGCGAPLLHGGLNRADRDKMVADFQSPSGPPVFILSLRAGGTGLNLTAANRVIHFDRWWNPAVENQATDRAYRIGQTRAVTVHAFLCPGTLEERIDQLIEEKVHLAGELVGEGESWLADLSDRELRDILELSVDSVGESGVSPVSLVGKAAAADVFAEE